VKVALSHAPQTSSASSVALQASTAPRPGDAPSPPAHRHRVFLISPHCCNENPQIGSGPTCVLWFMCSDDIQAAGIDHASTHHKADLLFCWSSSTSVNSASTTSSLAPPAGPSPLAPPSCALYMASPSFMDTCARVFDLALIAAASSPLRASLRSASAFSIARR